MSDLGPLTTTFTAPAACESDRGFYEIHSDDIVYDFMGPMNVESCYPDNYATTRGAYYSPGVCPSGYTAACSRLNSVDTVTQTIHTCCPDVLEYECIVNSVRRVHSKFVCEHWLEDDSGTWTVSPLTRISGGNTAATTKTGENNVAAVNAYGIEVRFIGDVLSTSSSESSDSAASSATPEASESNPSASASQTAAPAGEGEEEEGEEEDNGGMSTGTVVGIAVGAALGGLLIGGLIIWFLFRKWMKKRNDEMSEQKHFSNEAASTAHGGNGSPGPMTASTPGGWSQSGHSPGTSPPPPGTAGMYTQNSGHTPSTPTPFGSQHQQQQYGAPPPDQYQAYQQQYAQQYHQKQASYREQPLPPVPGQGGKPLEMDDTSYHHEMDATPAIEMPAGDYPAQQGHTRRS